MRSLAASSCKASRPTPRPTKASCAASSKRSGATVIRWWTSSVDCVLFNLGKRREINCEAKNCGIQIRETGPECLGLKSFITGRQQREELGDRSATVNLTRNQDHRRLRGT